MMGADCFRLQKCRSCICADTLKYCFPALWIPLKLTSVLSGQSDRRAPFCVSSRAKPHWKIPLQAFFPRKNSFLEVFFAAFLLCPDLKHQSQNGKSASSYAPRPDYSASQKYLCAENRFQYSGLNGYQKPKVEMRKIVIKFASNTRKN
ncbi:hypothetical protein AGR1B_Cc40106 [Agrobacterium fabacearum S56]|nr:hypothetical protein AGR1B_Cc40106 [Agrobacterium fabacearum S56]